VTTTAIIKGATPSSASSPAGAADDQGVDASSVRLPVRLSASTIPPLRPFGFHSSVPSSRIASIATQPQPDRLFPTPQPRLTESTRSRHRHRHHYADTKLNSTAYASNIAPRQRARGVTIAARDVLHSNTRGRPRPRPSSDSPHPLASPWSSSFTPLLSLTNTKTNGENRQKEHTDTNQYTPIPLPSVATSFRLQIAWFHV
jgi:hypothetical protein